MKFENYIARRTIFSGKKNLTKLILKIAYASVGLSVAVMILSTTMINGFKHEISKKIFGFWGHIDITNSNMTRGYDMIPFEKTVAFYDALNQIKEPISYKAAKTRFGTEIDGAFSEKKTKGAIDFVRSYLIVPGIINTRNDFEGGLLKGADKDFHWKQMNQYIIAGDTIVYEENKPNEQAVISSILAKRIGLEIGSKFLVHFIQNKQEIKKRFVVSGIYSTGLEEYDEKFMIVDIRHLQSVLGWKENEVAGLEVYVDDIDDIDVINDYIYYDIIPDDKYAESIKTKFASIFEWLNMQDTNERLILALMLIVAIVNMITTLLILILEQTHLIGVLKSLGSTDWKIRKIFLYQASYIIVKGLAIANVLGIGLALVQKYLKLIKLDEANYFLSYAPIRFDFFEIAIINVMTIVIILLSLIIPSYLISKMNPVKALRIN